MKSTHKFFTFSLETKVGLAIILIVIVIFAFVIFRGMSDFNESIEKSGFRKVYNQIEESK